MSAEFNALMASNTANKLAVAELSELLENQLYFMVLSNHINSTTLQTFKEWKLSLNCNNVFYLNVDDYLVYDGFYNDFGPLNLAMIYRYIGIVRDKFKSYKKIVHCTHKVDQKKRANAAFLICAYMVIEENWTAYQAYTVLSQHYKYQYMPFRDASCLVSSDYSVTVEECVNALFKAKWFGFFNFNDFDVDEYEKYETVKYGDINWIVPDTLLAFSSPHSRDYIDKSGYQIHSPAYYFQYFKENNVKHVVRLNSKKTYDAKRTFVAVANIQHSDLVFTDGTPPTDSILSYFLRLCEEYINDDSEVECTNNEIGKFDANNTNKIVNNVTKSPGAVAVHCKAGLGRTGCLIASFMIKHWSFTAVEAIAWIRICRPGSVIGAQQQWLIEKEEYLKTVGKQWRKFRKHNVDKYKRFTNGVYSIKRHTFKINTHEYVNPPPHSCLSNKEQSSCCSSDGSQIECVQSDTHSQSQHSPELKKKLKTNNCLLLNDQNDVHRPILRPKRFVVKNEEFPSSSIIKSNRQMPTLSIEMNINKSKTINTPPTLITVTKSNSKASILGKKNTKTINSNKTCTRSSRMSTAIESTTKTAAESKPSYTLATIASSARASRRLRNQNCITK